MKRRYSENMIDGVRVAVTVAYASRRIRWIPFMPKFGMSLPDGDDILVLLRPAKGKAFRSGLIHESGHWPQLLGYSRLGWIFAQLKYGRLWERQATERENAYKENRPLPPPIIEFDPDLLADSPPKEEV